MKIKTNDCLDIMDINQGHIIDSYGYCTRVYELTGVDYVFKSDIEINSIVFKLETFLEQLSSDYSLQFLIDTSFKNDLIEKKSLINTDDDVIRELFEHRVNYQKNKEIRLKKIYLAVSYSPKIFRKGFFKLEKQKDISIEEGIAQLDSAYQRALSLLPEVGCNLVQLNDNEIYQLLFKILNPKKSTYSIPKLDIDQCEIDVNSFLHSPINNTMDYLECDSTFIRTAYIERLPVFSQLKFLIELDFDFNNIISIRINKCKDVSKKITSLQIQKNILSSSGGALSSLLGIAESTSSSEKSNQAIEEIDSTIQRVSRSDESLFEYSFVVSCYGEHNSEVERNIQLVESKIQQINNTEIIQSRYNHLNVFLSMVPSQYNREIKHNIILAKPLVYLLPIHKHYMGGSAELYLEGHNKQLVSFSFKDPMLNAGHSLIVAPSGTGKSFLCNYFIDQLLQDSNNVLSILDKGGSYKKLSTMYDCVYLSITLEEQFSINVFPKRKDFIQGDTFDRNKLVFLKEFLSIAILDEKSSLMAFQEQVIEDTLIEFYRSIDIDPVLSDYVNYLEGIENANQDFLVYLIKSLKVYCHQNSAYEILLNRKSGFDVTQSRFTVFDITHLKDHPRLERLYLFLINNILTEKMHDLVTQNKTQYIFFEEAWSVIKCKRSSALIEHFYREGRKYGCKIISISQSANDFSIDHTKVIPDNSDIKFILSHPKDKQDGLETLKLNENDLEIIASIKPKKQVFCKFLDKKFVFNVDVSPVHKELYSTDSNSIFRYENINNKKDLFREMVSHA